MPAICLSSDSKTGDKIHYRSRTLSPTHQPIFTGHTRSCTQRAYEMLFTQNVENKKQFNLSIFEIR